MSNDQWRYVKYGGMESMEAEVALMSSVEVLTGMTYTIGESIITSCGDVKGIRDEMLVMKTEV